MKISINKLYTLINALLVLDKALQEKTADVSGAALCKLGRNICAMRREFVPFEELRNKLYKDLGEKPSTADSAWLAEQSAVVTKLEDAAKVEVELTLHAFTLADLRLDEDPCPNKIPVSECVAILVEHELLQDAPCARTEGVT